MSDAKSFFDTSVLLYLLSTDNSKADRVEELLQHSRTISVQMLNEFTAVAIRKLACPSRRFARCLTSSVLFA